MGEMKIFQCIVWTTSIPMGDKKSSIPTSKIKQQQKRINMKCTVDLKVKVKTKTLRRSHSISSMQT